MNQHFNKSPSILWVCCHTYNILACRIQFKSLTRIYIVLPTWSLPISLTYISYIPEWTLLLKLNYHLSTLFQIFVAYFILFPGMHFSGQYLLFSHPTKYLLWIMDFWGRGCSFIFISHTKPVLIRVANYSIYSLGHRKPVEGMWGQPNTFPGIFWTRNFIFLCLAYYKKK